MNPRSVSPGIVRATVVLLLVATGIFSMGSAAVGSRGGGLVSKAAKAASLPLVQQKFVAFVRFITPHSSVAAEPATATLDIPGAGGGFSVPYIQASPDLQYTLDTNGPPKRTTIDVVLDQGRPAQQTQRLTTPPWAGTFDGLGYGDHTLDARVYVREEGTPVVLGPWGPPVTTGHIDHIGRGDVIIAMGDSITEGLRDGPFAPGVAERLGYFRDWVTARDILDPYAAGMVSADGRNFPQASAATHLTSHPGFEGPLSRLLENSRGRPVLVVNEGWSGIDSAGFVQVTESQHFHDLVATTHPDGWLINLGANDMLSRRPAAEFQARLTDIIGNLNRLGAAAPDIHLACPNYRSDSTRTGVETNYLPVVDSLRARFGLGAGPDFFSHYRDHKGERADWVHPNGAGYAAMAQMWADALGGHGSNCV